MTDKLKIEVQGSKEISIELINEKAKEWKKGEKGVRELFDSISPNGEMSYTRNDNIALGSILSRIDMKKYQVRDWKEVMTIGKKLRECYNEDSNILKLSESEANFLKLYLKNFPEKEGKEDPLRQFDLATYFYLLEELGE